MKLELARRPMCFLFVLGQLGLDKLEHHVLAGDDAAQPLPLVEDRQVAHTHLVGHVTCGRRRLVDSVAYEASRVTNLPS